MEDVVSYYFAPSHGYRVAIWIRFKDGRVNVWSAGPNVKDDLAYLREAGIPEEKSATGAT